MCVEYITDFDGVGIYSIPSIQLSYLSIFETISIFGNIGPEKLKKKGAACLTKTSCSSPIAEIIVLQLLTSQKHSYTSLGKREIKMDRLTAQVVCL